MLMRPLRLAAFSAIAVATAGGCVSTKEFTSVARQRDQLAQEKTELSFKLNDTSNQLSQTLDQRTVAEQEYESLTIELQQSYAKSDQIAKRAAETAARLTQTQSTLAMTESQLKTTRAALSQSERGNAELQGRFAASEKKVGDLSSKLDLMTADLAKVREESRIQSAKAATQLNEVRTVL